LAPLDDRRSMMAVEYSEKYLQYLRDLEEKNKYENSRKPGAYYSTQKEDGEYRNMAAEMFARFG
jgi:hypothetical protein